MERTLKLCNFNKIDKLDVESLTLWTQVYFIAFFLLV